MNDIRSGGHGDHHSSSAGRPHYAIGIYRFLASFGFNHFSEIRACAVPGCASAAPVCCRGSRCGLCSTAGPGPHTGSGRVADDVRGPGNHVDETGTSTCLGIGASCLPIAERNLRHRGSFLPSTRAANPGLLAQALGSFRRRLPAAIRGRNALEGAPHPGRRRFGGRVAERPWCGGLLRTPEGQRLRRQVPARPLGGHVLGLYGLLRRVQAPQPSVYGTPCTSTSNPQASEK